jgi:hypothetical protein
MMSLKGYSDNGPDRKWKEGQELTPYDDIKSGLVRELHMDLHEFTAAKHVGGDILGQ